MLKLTLKRQISIIVIILATTSPMILVAVLASFYYYLGVESFFNEKVSKAISDTVTVARLYLDEHKKNIKADIYSIANNIGHNYYLLIEEPNLTPLLLDKQSSMLNLSEVAIFTKEMKVIASNTLGFSLMFENLPIEALQKADTSKEAVLIEDNNDYKVRAILKLHNFFDTYLVISRYIDPQITNYLVESSYSAEQYAVLWGNIKLTRNKLIILFICISAILCTIAILISNRLSNFITKPLVKLINATQLVKDGNFTTRLPENKNLPEIQLISTAFNSMIEHIAMQRSELMQANDVINARRRFIEKILIELSSGVIVIDELHQITLHNHVANNILRLPETAKLISNNIVDIFPEILGILDNKTLNLTEHLEEQLIITRNNQSINLLIKVGTVKNAREEIESIIITMTDITELVGAQKAAAWTEIAKRIAHEVKNPLTPIHLSAERLKKKYSEQIIQDQENFVKYVDTIIRHVNDIELMLTEFLSFARAPSPKFAAYDICLIIREVIFLQKNAFNNIEYQFYNQDCSYYVYCDKAQISQVIINLLKNAAESILAKQAVQTNFQGVIKIDIKLYFHNKKSGDSLVHHQNMEYSDKCYLIVAIEDNGCGISNTIINKITEPYVTTKSKGTGLGLAIVKKIITDHGGRFMIFNIPNGACAQFSLNIPSREK